MAMSHLGAFVPSKYFAFIYVRVYRSDAANTGAHSPGGTLKTSDPGINRKSAYANGPCGRCHTAFPLRGRLPSVNQFPSLHRSAPTRANQLVRVLGVVAESVRRAEVLGRAVFVDSHSRSDCAPMVR